MARTRAHVPDAPAPSGLKYVSPYDVATCIDGGGVVKGPDGTDMPHLVMCTPGAWVDKFTFQRCSKGRYDAYHDEHFTSTPTAMSVAVSYVKYDVIVANNIAKAYPKLLETCVRHFVTLRAPSLSREQLSYRCDKITHALMLAKDRESVDRACEEHQRHLPPLFSRSWAGVLVPEHIFKCNLYMFLKGNSTQLLSLVASVYAMQRLLAEKNIHCNAAMFPKHNGLATHCIRLDRVGMIHTLYKQNPYFSMTDAFVEHVIRCPDADLFAQHANHAALQAGLSAQERDDLVALAEDMRTPLLKLNDPLKTMPMRRSRALWAYFFSLDPSARCLPGKWHLGASIETDGYRAFVIMKRYELKVRRLPATSPLDHGATNLASSSALPPALSSPSALSPAPRGRPSAPSSPSPHRAPANHAPEGAAPVNHPPDPPPDPLQPPDPPYTPPDVSAAMEREYGVPYVQEMSREQLSRYTGILGIDPNRDDIMHALYWANVRNVFPGDDEDLSPDDDGGLSPDDDEDQSLARRLEAGMSAIHNTVMQMDKLPGSGNQWMRDTQGSRRSYSE
jgi:hypothetical protein